MDTLKDRVVYILYHHGESCEMGLACQLYGRSWVVR